MICAPVPDNTKIMSVGLIKSNRLFTGLIGFGTQSLATVSSVSFIYSPTLGFTLLREVGFLFLCEKWAFKRLPSGTY